MILFRTSLLAVPLLTLWGAEFSFFKHLFLTGDLYGFIIAIVGALICSLVALRLLSRDIKRFFARVSQEPQKYWRSLFFLACRFILSVGAPIVCTAIIVGFAQYCTLPDSFLPNKTWDFKTITFITLGNAIGSLIFNGTYYALLVNILFCDAACFAKPNKPRRGPFKTALLAFLLTLPGAIILLCLPYLPFLISIGEGALSAIPLLVCFALTVLCAFDIHKYASSLSAPAANLQRVNEP